MRNLQGQIETQGSGTSQAPTAVTSTVNHLEERVKLIEDLLIAAKAKKSSLNKKEIKPEIKKPKK